MRSQYCATVYGINMLQRIAEVCAVCFWLLSAVCCLDQPSRAPQFLAQPLSTFQKYGGSVTLSCAVDPADAVIFWRLNGVQLGGVPGVLVSGGSLVIASLNNDTAGRYQCIAQTAAGAMASVPAIVALANLQDFKSDTQHVIEVDEGNTAVIACNLPESHPKAQVRYSVKQEWLETSRDNYLIMPSGNLQIVNATQEDEGTYQCAAYNPVTQEVKTSVSSDRLRVRRSISEVARIIYPPVAQTIIVTKGQSLFLECVASGMPPPRITWAKDGSDIIEQNKTRFLLSNLLIESTSEEDSGTYTCTASNGMGDGGLAFIFYNVQVFEPPEVRMEMSLQMVSWGQTAKFTCEVNGNPPPSVVWLRNAVPVVPTPKHRISLKVLRVSSVGPEDDGIYQCMAENEVGSAQALTLLMTTKTGTLVSPGLDVITWTPTEAPIPDDKQLLLKAQIKPRPPTPGSPTPCPSDKTILQPEAPIILSSPRTSKTDFYELVWKPRHNSKATIQYYTVKHRKVGNVSDEWTFYRVPGSQNRLTLTKLDPGSLYEVEMAAYNCVGEGQTSMMTFRTGRRPKPDIIASKEAQIQKDDPGTSTQSSNQSDNNRLSPPEAPDRPTISAASETSVYVTWIPRGNGGFPIQSFRVEYKKLKQQGDWILVTRDVPPSRLSVEITDLEKGMSYKFRVRAMNILGESQPSAASKPYMVSGYTNRINDRPVTGPYITFTEAINETTIMLKWMYVPSSNNNTPIHGFYIYYRPTDSDNDSDYKKDVVEGDRYWHSISHLQPETSYDIKMRCYNEGGESEFSNVMICETKARKSSSQPGRPPQSVVLTAPPPPSRGGALGTATVARSSDLPYLIVGVVLGSIVLLIVAFTPICLWRALSKQKQTTDITFPSSGILNSSCQYTMVPLRGTPAVSTIPHSNGAFENGACPPAKLIYSGGKQRDYCSKVRLQEEASTLLSGSEAGPTEPRDHPQPSGLCRAQSCEMNVLYEDETTHPHVEVSHPEDGTSVQDGSQFPILDVPTEKLLSQGAMTLSLQSTLGLPSAVLPVLHSMSQTVPSLLKGEGATHI
ncbi:PREDICTED: brother of CDO [Nanorana parkeri]|uniref:brother of CDO n=1 Tax=Nanorana parkeri TaxID=125878 RepID=UPI0008541BD1|nr:PREDICTED: brother of CDO [Nanorana parkeri]